MKSHLRSKILLCSLFISPAFAGTITFLNAPAVAVDTVNWAQLGGDLSTLAKNFTATSANGVVVNGMLSGTDGLLSVVCAPVNPTQCSWGAQSSGYSTGDTLLWAENTNNAGSGPITLSFAAQFGVGAYVQSTSTGPFTATLTLFNGATTLGSHLYTSDTPGSPLFLGATDTVQEITKAVFAVNSCGSFACDPNDFSMDTLQIYRPATVTPEPSTTWLAGSLLTLGLASFQLRKTSKSPKGNRQ